MLSIGGVPCVLLSPKQSNDRVMMGTCSNYVTNDLINAIQCVNYLAFVNVPVNGGFSMCFKIVVSARKGTTAKKPIMG